ncbi:MAG: hypothetical protein ACLR1G_09340 [Alistipes indistinctus]
MHSGSLPCAGFSSAAKRPIVAAIAPGSPGATNSLFRSFSTSGIPETGVETTGSPGGHRFEQYIGNAVPVSVRRNHRRLHIHRGSMNTTRAEPIPAL